MPVKSVAQERFLGANKPQLLKKWKAEGVKTSTKGLPYKVGGAPRPPTVNAHVRRGQTGWK